VFDVPVSSLQRFRGQFDPPYLGDLDDGEAELLAFMVEATEPYVISSGDAIVYRIFGNLNQRPFTDIFAQVDRWQYVVYSIIS
jgi:hypothetical protein